jgi:flagellar biogenesis protein FliO
MKRIFSKLLILPLILAWFAPICFAQNANTEAPANQSAEVLGENERLPFMHTEENPQSQEPSSGGLLLKTLGAMLLIVGLIFFGAWTAKKLGLGGMKSNNSPDEFDLTVLSSLSIGKDRTISIVRFGERVLVVGSTPQSFTLLAEESSGEKVSIQNSRSVAEMLAEENDSFADEFEQAQIKLSLWEEKGVEI